MRTFITPALVLIALFGTATAGLTQTVRPVSELAFDLVGRVAAVGATGTKLYTTALRTSRDIAPGIHVQFYGTHRYGLFGVQQASVEKEWGGNAGQAQAGIIRLPFGIYDPRETYASGLINYPLARGDYAYHSVDWGVPGIGWTGGPANIQIEAAGFSGLSSGIWNNQAKLRGGAVRVQTAAGDAILGVSRWEGAMQEFPHAPGTRPVHLTGLDLRYTKTQLLMRGEYLFGTLAGNRMTGWYLDGYYRLPGHEQWSLVGRLESLKPGADDPAGRQTTLGVRYVASREWTLSVNWRHNNGLPYGKYWTPAALKNGDVYLEAYHRLGW